MVCDERNHRVQVFELSGKFVTKFGSKGSESGEFRYPVCTANIGDGRIVVCRIRITTESSCLIMNDTILTLLYMILVNVTYYTFIIRSQ